MSDATKIFSLFNKGYKQAAFSKKANAEYFAHLWEEQGYEVGFIKSSGPTMEEPKKRVLHAYYVIAKNTNTNYKKGTKSDYINKILGKF